MAAPTELILEDRCVPDWMHKLDSSRSRKVRLLRAGYDSGLVAMLRASAHVEAYEGGVFFAGLSGTKESPLLTLDSVAAWQPGAGWFTHVVYPELVSLHAHGVRVAVVNIVSDRFLRRLNQLGFTPIDTLSEFMFCVQLTAPTSTNPLTNDTRLL